MTTKDRNEPGATNVTTVERVSDCEVVVTRWFDAPAHVVFEAWSNPELFRKWWVPESMGMTLQGCEMDVHTGGRYRLDYGGGVEFFGRYIEVTPPSRIVWTNDEDGDEASVTTVTFAESEGRTRLVMSELYPTKQALDAAGMGAQEATHETFAQLEALLATLR